MILDVCQCSQLFFDVFSWVVTFMDNHPLCGHFFSGCPQLITDILQRFSDVFKMCSDVLRCSQMFSGFQIVDMIINVWNGMIVHTMCHHQRPQRLALLLSFPCCDINTMVIKCNLLFHSLCVDIRKLSLQKYSSDHYIDANQRQHKTRNAT